MGDNASAREAYEEFLTIWKDADRDLPIYRQAKAEYVRLRNSDSQAVLVSRVRTTGGRVRAVGARAMDARYDKRTIEPAEASAGRRPELRLSDRIGPVIAVVASAMSTIIAKICGVRMPRS
jgi:hypothetical protein